MRKNIGIFLHVYVWAVNVGVGQTLRLEIQIQKTQTETQLHKQLPLPLLIDFLCAQPALPFLPKQLNLTRFKFANCIRVGWAFGHSAPFCQFPLPIHRRSATVTLCKPLSIFITCLLLCILIVPNLSIVIVVRPGPHPHPVPLPAGPAHRWQDLLGRPHLPSLHCAVFCLRVRY